MSSVLRLHTPSICPLSISVPFYFPWSRAFSGPASLTKAIRPQNPHPCIGSPKVAPTAANLSLDLLLHVWNAVKWSCVSTRAFQDHYYITPSLPSGLAIYISHVWVQMLRT